MEGEKKEEESERRRVSVNVLLPVSTIRGSSMHDVKWIDKQVDARLRGRVAPLHFVCVSH